MGGMTLNTAITLEEHRRLNGQFGSHMHSPPETGLHQALPNPENIPVTIPHVTEVLGPFRRLWQIETELTATLRIDHLPGDAGTSGDGGERILDGQAYLPVLREGLPVAAESTALDSLARHAADDIGDLDEDSRIAQQQFRRHMARHSRLGVIIGGDLWVRASRSSWVNV